MKAFLQRLLTLRQALPNLINPLSPPRQKLKRQPHDQGDLWQQWHGVELGQPDWAAWSRTTATSLHMGSRGALLWIGFNAYKEPLDFALPVPASPWMRVVDTAMASPDDLPEDPEPFEGVEIELDHHSMVVLVAREVANGLKF